jgi:phosphate transport system permease protein
MSHDARFTGRARRRQTRRGVFVADRAARIAIAVGGIGTIAAVLLVCVFLLKVVLPLFARPTAAPGQRFAAAWDQARRPLRIGMDEHQTIGWALLADGALVSFRADTGQSLGMSPATEGPSLTVATFGANNADCALGFADGSIRVGRVAFSTRFLPAESLPKDILELPIGGLANHDDGVVQRTPDNAFRWQRIELSLQPPIPGSSASPIRLLDYVVDANDQKTYCTLTDDGKLRINRVSERKNRLTDEVTFRVTSGELPLPAGSTDPADYLLLSELGDNVFLAWDDGRLLRFDTRDFDAPQLAEEVDLVPEEGIKLTALSWLLGRTTLLAGDSTGRVRAWFRTQPVEAATPDGNVLVAAHEFPGGGSDVTTLTSSARSRVMAAGYADGTARLFHVTAERSLLDLPAMDAAPVGNLAIAAANDGLLRATAAGIDRWSIDLKHPEASLSALFLPVWYEGYERPMWMWQSTGSNDSEPKLSLVPLVFGTLKATFYSLLFGVPLALLAAVYTSEFLHPRIKARVKPTIELMASLPSVVLGFLAALVIAPVVEQVVPAAIAAFAMVPLAFLFGAYLWQLVPHKLALLMAPWRFVLIVVSLPLGLLLAWWAGPWVERWLFAGNIKAWLDGQIGTGAGGWMLLLLPLSGVAMFALGREVNSWLRAATSQWGRPKLALVDLFKFIVGAAAAVAVAWAASMLLNSLRFDPRGDGVLALVDSYDQRNALVVGFIMGFAIIPIIYTIADDALSSVPEHLRSASLGAGATPWQTATRIVIPTAMSGLFSAVMVGLGRAVGETMIVLMAAGNTPVMKLNIFEGFRTLSANLAVELPEAVEGSTHYLTLYLAALVLFAFTFVVNTVAEVVRMRFRRRAYEL